MIYRINAKSVKHCKGKGKKGDYYRIRWKTGCIFNVPENKMTYVKVNPSKTNDL